MRMKPFVVLSLALVLLASARPVQAQSSGASLSAGSASGLPGDTGLSIPVSLSSDAGTEVTGLNFDLNFDSTRLTVQNVTIGGTASSAGKALSWSTPSSGRVRVLIFGLNQTAIQNGTVANVVVGVNMGASPGSSTLSFSNAMATDPSGSPVPLSTSSGAFTITAPPPPPATATATYTAAPPTPSPTATAQPKTLPTSTSPNTATVQPTNTSKPTNTQAFTATATRTPTPTITQVSTLTSGTTLQPSPTGTITSTTTADLSNSPTPTLSGGDDLGSSAADAPRELGATLLDDSLELAVAATSTALAAKEDSIKDSNESFIDVGADANPGEVLTNRLIDILSNSALIAQLFLGTGIVSALLVPPVGIYLYRNRTAFSKRSKNDRSPHTLSGKDQLTDRWNSK